MKAGDGTGAPRRPSFKEWPLMRTLAASAELKLGPSRRRRQRMDSGSGLNGDRFKFDKMDSHSLEVISCRSSESITGQSSCISCFCCRAVVLFPISFQTNGM